MTSGPGTLRVAAAQAESVPGDLAANVATAVPLVEQAADRGARVVVLPELFLTGYAYGGAMDKEMLAGYGVSADCIIMKPLTIDRYLEAVRCFPSIGLSLVKLAKAAY